MWGNDPQNRFSNYNPQATQTIINPELKETRINADLKLPINHLGFNGRLNGAVDNPYSSCISCHMTAQHPVVSNMLPQFNTSPTISIPAKGTQASLEWIQWFRNIKCSDTFNPNTVSFGCSLQLLKSIQNYYAYLAKTNGGTYHQQYRSPKITHNQVKKHLSLNNGTSRSPPEYVR